MYNLPQMTKSLFALRLAVTKIFVICHFPLTTILNVIFHFFKLRLVTGSMCRKLLTKYHTYFISSLTVFRTQIETLPKEYHRICKRFFRGTSQSSFPALIKMIKFVSDALSKAILLNIFFATNSCLYPPPAGVSTAAALIKRRL